MKIQWQIVLIPTFACAVALAVVGWRTDRLILRDKTEFSLDAAEKQLNPLKRAIAERVAKDQRLLVNAVENREIAKLKASEINLFFGDFQAIAGVAIGASRKWTVQWTEKLESSTANQWPVGMANRMVQDLPFAKINDKEAYWSLVKDVSGDFISVLATRVKVSVQTESTIPAGPLAAGQTGVPKPSVEKREQIIVGFYKSNWIQTFVNDYRGSFEEVIVFSERGKASAHTSPNLVGKDIKSLTLVSDALKKRFLNETRNFKNEKGEDYIGIADQIPNANLFASISLPRDYVFRLTNSYREALLAVGAGALILILMFTLFIGQDVSRRLGGLRAFVIELTKGNFEGQLIPKSKDDLGRLGVAIAQLQAELMAQKNKGPSKDDFQSERMTAYGQLGKGIATSLKEPIMTILGHAQLARSKANEETKDHYVVIERESRRAKSVLDKLARFSGLDQVQHEELNIKEVVESALKSISHEMETRGITLLASLKDVAPIYGHESQIRTVINSLCNNSADAMAESSQREIRIGLSQMGSFIRLAIEDTGPGIPPEVKAKIFEPFYKSSGSDESLGLGLSLVLGIVNEHRGKISVHSEPGQGTQIFIDFPSKETADSAVETVIKSPLDFQNRPDPAKPLDQGQAMADNEAAILPSAPEQDEVTFVGDEIPYEPPPENAIQATTDESEDDGIMDLPDTGEIEIITNEVVKPESENESESMTQESAIVSGAPVDSTSSEELIDADSVNDQASEGKSIDQEKSSAANNVIITTPPQSNGEGLEQSSLGIESSDDHDHEHPPLNVVYGESSESSEVEPATQDNSLISSGQSEDEESEEYQVAELSTPATILDSLDDSATNSGASTGMDAGPSQDLMSNTNLSQVVELGEEGGDPVDEAITSEAPEGLTATNFNEIDLSKPEDEVAPQSLKELEESPPEGTIVAPKQIIDELNEQVIEKPSTESKGFEFEDDEMDVASSNSEVGTVGAATIGEEEIYQTGEGVELESNSQVDYDQIAYPEAPAETSKPNIEKPSAPPQALQDFTQSSISDLDSAGTQSVITRTGVGQDGQTKSKRPSRVRIRKPKRS